MDTNDVLQSLQSSEGEPDFRRDNVLTDLTNINETLPGGSQNTFESMGTEQTEQMTEENHAEVVRERTPFIARKTMHTEDNKLEEKRKKAAQSEKRCKRSKTLFKKTEEIASVYPEVLTILKDEKGRWFMSGTPGLEANIINGQPLVDISKCTVYKYNQTSVDAELSFEEATAPTLSVSAPMTLPVSVMLAVPGSLNLMENVEKFSSASTVSESVPTEASMAPITPDQVVAVATPPVAETENTAPTNESEPTTSHDAPKKRNGKGRGKRVPVAGKAMKPKRPYRKNKAVTMNCIAAMTAESDDDDDLGPAQGVCSFRNCMREYDSNERWVQCKYCDRWSCPKCSRTEGLKKKVIAQIKFKCQKCRE